MKEPGRKGVSEKNPQWRISETPVPYGESIDFMESRAKAIRDGEAPELVWLLEHPSLYTAGTSAAAEELIDSKGIPVFQTGRGGKTTYHGPGQRLAYVLCDIQKRDRDVRAHVWRLEEWVLRVLDDLGVRGERRKGRVGLWVSGPDGSEKKIAAIGVKVRRWVTYHGLALNVCPDLSRFDGIVPCGLKDYGVTSLHEKGVTAPMDTIDALFQKNWPSVF